MAVGIDGFANPRFDNIRFKDNRKKFIREVNYGY